MDKSKVIAASAAALVAIIAVSGIAFYSSAAEDTDTSESNRPYFQRNFENLSEEEIAEKKAEWEAMHEEKMAERDERREAMDAAIQEGYSAWQALVMQEHGEDADILDKVDADNFDIFAGAHNKMQEARATFEELGIEKGGKGGFGKGFKKGMRHGMGMHKTWDANGEAPQVE